MGAAHRESTGHAGHIGRGQHQRVFFTFGRGHHHDDLAHARHVGRDGIHQHARWIRRLAAGHIDADPVQRRDLLAEQRAVGVNVAPALAAGLFLRFVVAAHARGGGLQGFALNSGNGLEGGFQLGLRQLQLRQGDAIQGVKALGVLQHRRIAAMLHVQQDVGHALLNGGIGCRRPMQARFEISLKCAAGG